MLDPPLDGGDHLARVALEPMPVERFGQPIMLVTGAAADELEARRIGGRPDLFRAVQQIARAGSRSPEPQ